MPAKIVFLVATVAGAVSSAFLAGVIVVIVGICTSMPTDALITLAADTTAAVFGGVVALAALTASLFLDNRRSGPATAVPVRGNQYIVHPAASGPRPSPGLVAARETLVADCQAGDTRLLAALARPIRTHRDA